MRNTILLKKRARFLNMRLLNSLKTARHDLSTLTGYNSLKKLLEFFGSQKLEPSTTTNSLIAAVINFYL